MKVILYHENILYRQMVVSSHYWILKQVTLLFQHREAVEGGSISVDERGRPCTS